MVVTLAMSKNLILTNTAFNSTGIFGNIKSLDGSLSLVTLQRAYPVVSEGESTSYLPKVSPGTYDCLRYYSHKHGYDVFWVTRVKNNGVDPTDAGKEFYDFIELHIGNFNKDSEGCILLGLHPGPDCILNSEKAFEQFMAYFSGVNSFQLTVV